MRRRDFIYTLGGIALVACSADSCDKDSGVITTPTLPPKRAPSPIGTSNVATLTARDVEICARAGLTLVQAEMIPFDKGGGTINLDRDFPRIQDAVTVARNYGMTFILTLVNWNGDTQRAQGISWFSALVDRTIKDIGPAGVWLEPVSEPGPEAVSWLQLAKGRWPGATIEERQPYGATYGSRHYCRYSDMLAGVQSRDIIHSTDCNGNLASQLTENEVKEVTRAAVDARRKLILYDTDNAPGLNLSVVNWMKEVIQEGKS